MKQIEQNYRSGVLRVIDAPAPRVGAGRVLVATSTSLISAGTEKQIVDLAKSSLAGKAIARPDLVRQVMRKVRAEGLAPVARKVFAKLDTPIPLGYSLAGTVIEAGDGSGFSIGDRVACAGAGTANHAEYNAVPKNLCVRVPSNVSDDAAAFVTLGAIALQGVRVAAPTLGETVVVSGLGLIGLLTVQLLKANGCVVIGFDPNPRRAELAREMGADIAISTDLASIVAQATAGNGADAVIVTASTKSNVPANEAAEISRMKGRVVIVGMVGMALDREPFYKRELDLRLSMSYGPGRYDPAYEQQGHDYPLPYVRWTEQRNMEAFLRLVAEGRVTPDRLITHRFPIADATDAYALMETSEPYLAIMLDYPEDTRKPPERAISVFETTRGQTAQAGATAFIGFGNYARSVLLPAYRAAGGGSLDAVVTSTSISAYGAAEKFGFARAVTDPGTVFADSAISDIFIATRHDSHAALAVQALEAGKNVFLEKPLALNDEQLDRVEVAARASSSVLTVGFNRRFAPMTIEAQALFADRQAPLVMNYRINAGPIPRESWVHSNEGGGRIVGEVCHFVDFLSAVAGSPPMEVARFCPRGPDASLVAVLRFADGSVATITYATVGDASLAKERIEIFGPGAIVVIDDFSSIEISRNGKTKRRRARQDKGQVELVKRFLAAARGAAPAPIDLDTLLSVSRATIALA
ncbi:MAG: bi-domain-containing oxidoreductase [Sphingomonas sp.]|uniref:bi-domain-containing oxidoreductase n=1 Tax=Sphingomonas sp. TaxID=28214 RepID=UPI001AC10ED6|nr:bi-domain-containing oxidoreductase [Sphingomonas sp.]MBN8806914.1 bi-domain-containing oxidoreductase [Sphingomonas sp.]